MTNMVCNGDYDDFHYEALFRRENELFTAWTAIIDLDGKILGAINGRIHRPQQRSDIEMKSDVKQAVGMAIEDRLELAARAK